MEAQLLVALLLAVLVGISLGLLGGGGSILTVPILTYVVGMEPQAAIASSLFIVGTTSIFGMLSHARAKRVRWKTGLIFGAAGMVGALAGGLVGGFLPGALLMILFAVMMIATAVAMIRPSRAPSEESLHRQRPAFRIVLDGLLVGAGTGLVGAGGGFLVVPALTILGGLPIAVAVGTSLLVITMKSYAGLAGYLFNVQLDWGFVLAFTGAAIAGSFVGAIFAGRIPEKLLRKGFGYFVLAMGAIVLVQEVPPIIAMINGS